ncbi:ubiquitin carboxyl-terminal hydrolase 33 isoform X4 [Hyposmocoma kahamanoa]|uniref:ubiquitin carboxyl-terminal hydrolase 33 isoform X4 n=1 Tax=Hyposmocoma kahamanoa TaxID=1477025 RepID=UPI000E6D5C4F|nr:ubiquitin carboxyl-terminal hydrolase 33 isoform X4 [Hyposmocoma kahamanoa]
MDKGVTCEHLNKLSEHLGKELWQSKETLSCFDCGCTGPNLWICLQPYCHHVGCSEVKNDHSTLHQKSYPTHCVHMNVSTERIWCYLCEKEVYIRAALAHDAMSPDTTSMDGSVVTRLGSVGLSIPPSPDDDVDPDDMDFDEERPRGLVGLQNMGNTCYMNAALQALSNTAPLTSYFLECAAAVSVLAADKKPGLSRAYQKLIKDMWSRKTRGYVVPNGILYGIRNVHPMFRGYHQHDTQEFLRCFMDQLHEELKEPVWDSASEDKLGSEADGDHQESRGVHVRRRAASSGASDAPFFARMRRKSPAPSCYSDSRADGYLRVTGANSGAEGGAAPHAGARHRRSASFAGTQLAYSVLTHNGPDSTQRDIGSESELSCSSEAEDRYETCSSGASDTPDARPERPTGGAGGGDGGAGGVRYRSVISDVFDGKLLSSVQCLICDRVSTRVETFQDLSLPIPSREHLAVIRCQQPILNHHTAHATQESWVWWLLSWLRSWFYGPVVSLQDCLAAFFSADELKGDNMYSCSRCNKLRNGVKMSGVVRLPEVLCVHLKRFRHELMFSAKVGARVSFPIHDLNMAPYTHKDCTSKITRYDLCAVICHAGTAGGGHYTCVARNARGWYAFDDQCVAPVSPHQLANSEAYVLFYRKVNPHMAELRQKASEILESTNVEPNDIKFYISKQWINKFNTWAEPGPVDNSDFVCCHGGVRPDRASHLHKLAAIVPQPLWEFLHNQFGGGPAVSHAHECGVCARIALRLRTRRANERQAFAELHAIFQEQERPRAIYAISMHWFRQWQAFVRNKTQQPPPPVDNTGILTKQDIDGTAQYVLKPGSDHAQLSEELWRFFTDIYGGGPEVKLRSPQQTQTTVTVLADRDHSVDRRLSRKYSESDKEEYCTKSTSEMNIRDTFHGELQKNQSLQNINYKISRPAADSDEEVNYRHTFQYKREPNGNYQNSDEDMDTSPPHSYVNTVRMENGVDSSEHDANDNPVQGKQSDRLTDSELPNLDSISLKTKNKTGKVRKMKRRTVK